MVQLLSLPIHGVHQTVGTSWSPTIGSHLLSLGSHKPNKQVETLSNLYHMHAGYIASNNNYTVYSTQAHKDDSRKNI